MPFEPNAEVSPDSHQLTFLFCRKTNHSLLTTNVQRSRLSIYAFLPFFPSMRTSLFVLSYVSGMDCDRFAHDCPFVGTMLNGTIPNLYQPLESDCIIFSQLPHSPFQCSRLVRNHAQVLPGEDATLCLYCVHSLTASKRYRNFGCIAGIHLLTSDHPHTTTAATFARVNICTRTNLSPFLLSKCFQPHSFCFV